MTQDRRTLHRRTIRSVRRNDHLTRGWTRNAGGPSCGSRRAGQFAGMVNLLGRAPADELLEAADVSLHWYNKSIRSRRKVGHLNIQSADRQQLQKRLVELESALYPDGEPL